MSASGGEPVFKKGNNYKFICFTVNLKDGEDFDKVKKNDIFPLIYRALNASFIIVGAEVGEKDKRCHFQGYMELPDSTKGSKILKEFRVHFPEGINKKGYSVWLGNAKGSAESSIAYCSKYDKEPFTRGTPTGRQQGKRNDFLIVKKKIEEGATERQIAEEHFHLWAIHRRSFEAFRELTEPEEPKEKKLIFLWGETGTGKSMHARELNPKNITIEKGFLGGYTSTDKVVLFDDFKYENVDWRVFLQMTDWYPMQMNKKGSYQRWNPDVIIFTSNSHPYSWYPNAPEETKKAILRRIEEFGTMVHFTHFIPKDQKVMDQFFKTKNKIGSPSAREDPPSADGVAPPPTSPETFTTPPSSPEQVLRRRKEIVILPSDDEEEEANLPDSQESEYTINLRRKQLRQKAPQFIDLTEDSDTQQY